MVAPGKYNVPLLYLAVVFIAVTASTRAAQPMEGTTC